MSYKKSPAPVLNVPVSGKTFCAVAPNFWMLENHQFISSNYNKYFISQDALTQNRLVLVGLGVEKC